MKRSVLWISILCIVLLTACGAAPAGVPSVSEAPAAVQTPAEPAEKTAAPDEVTSDSEAAGEDAEKAAGEAVLPEPVLPYERALSFEAKGYSLHYLLDAESGLVVYFSTLNNEVTRGTFEGELRDGGTIEITYPDSEFLEAIVFAPDGSTGIRVDAWGNETVFPRADVEAVEALLPQ